MKVFSKLLMMTLALSVLFAGCGKDDDENPPIENPPAENLPLKDVAGTYEGTITVIELDNQVISGVSITVGAPADSMVLLTIPAGKIPVIPVEIQATCKVTSDSVKYSLSGTANVIIPETATIPVTIASSSNIDKTGKAEFDIVATVPAAMLPPGSLPEGVPELPINNKFSGQKK
jgi:hypothetical protein